VALTKIRKKQKRTAWALRLHFPASSILDTD
jgi:hypothetical protein